MNFKKIKLNNYEITNENYDTDNRNAKKISNNIENLITAIDKKDKKKIENSYLYLLSTNNENNKIIKEKDIVYEIYIKNKLNSERFQFIIENCISYINVSSFLIKKLMKDNNKDLLEILFIYHIKFFDIDIILKFLISHKNRIPISNSKLNILINNEKYKLSTELNENYDRYDSSYYLFNACESGNEAAVKFLLEHGADLTIKDKDNRIALAKACSNGNIHLVKYLIQHGADINNEYNSGVTHIFNACSSGNLDLVKYLVKQKANINKLMMV